jgi:Xaa-Pro dipeptidase
MRSEGLDAVALVPGPNLFYLTGAKHHAMERRILYILRSDGEDAVVLPALELGTFSAGGARTLAYAWTDAEGDERAFEDAFRSLGLGAGRIGVEDMRMRVFEYSALQRACPTAELVAAHAAISSMRLRKDPNEIESLRTAVRRSEGALESVLAQIRVGMTEQQIRDLLLDALREQGVGTPSFSPIVASGANSANPHATVRADAEIAEGDALLFDFGGTCEGYPADITRTVFVGRVPEEAARLYAAVLEANEVGRAATGPGVVTSSVDDAVHSVLVEHGFEQLILHRTGHGLGLEVHEAPYLSHSDATTLEPGMVVTIEPGLYLEGRFGIRIEDDVVVTEAGHESFTGISRELRTVG